MYRNKTARQKNFATIPSADVPRSRFRMRQTRKQAFNASELIPIMVEEVLPGDTWSHRESIMARLATPIAPVVDDIDLETFYFFVPNRILWEPWEEFITGTDTEVTVPTISPQVSDVNFTLNANSVFDHMGLLPQTYTTPLEVTAFPIMAYFTIFNEWFRDQNLQDRYLLPDPWTTNQPSYNILLENVGTNWNQAPLRINKRHDYVTASLPFAQKGQPVTIPLGTDAPVVPNGTGIPPSFATIGTGGGSPIRLLAPVSATNPVGVDLITAAGTPLMYWDDPQLSVDLNSATSATINALRTAFQTQKLLERDARGGSRYVEQLLAHFKVRSPDYRLQRPEYLGGSKIPITVNPIAQTAAYDAEPGLDSSAIGNLGAEMHASGSKKTFTYAATEHGYILGLAAVRATPTYQQATRRHWRRQTRLDYYFPVFAMLGEQAVATQEVFQPADNNPANATWGFQERWAEMRYTPNEITGVLRSTAAQPLDWWHYSEEFAGEPALNAAFITDKTQETLARSLATAPSEQWSAQIIMDILHDNTVGRLMPTYSVPGLIDHF